jgi:hypothetical protein
MDNPAGEAEEKKQHNYLVRMTKSQALLMVVALDLYSRIRAGQVSSIIPYVPSQQCSGQQPPVPVDYQLVRELVDLLGMAVNGSRGANWGIAAPQISETARTAYDMLQVIRNRIAWDDHPEGGMTVNFDTPMFFSKTPPISIVLVDDGYSVDFKKPEPKQ